MRSLRAVGVALLLAGLIVAGLGAYLGLSTVSRLDISCGTGFSGVDAGVAQMDRQRVSAAQQKQDESDLYDALTGQQNEGSASVSQADPRQLTNACEPAVDSRRTTALVVLIPGAAVAVAGVVMVVAAASSQAASSGRGRTSR